MRIDQSETVDHNYLNIKVTNGRCVIFIVYTVHKYENNANKYGLWVF
jgi:hypothetical protein